MNTSVINSLKTLMAVCAVCLFANTALCQFEGTVQGKLEMININSNFTTAPNLSFDVKFFSKQKDSIGAYVTDSISGSYKISNNNLWSMIDSVKSVQNAQYRVTVYEQDSSIYIGQPDDIAKSIFPNNFLDSNFLHNEVSNIVFTNYEDNTKKMTISFKSESPYLSYNLYYNDSTFLLNKMEFDVRETETDNLTITLVFSNYSTSAIDPTIFSTTPFFTEKNNKYVIAAAYTGYEIINPAKEIEYEAGY